MTASPRTFEKKAREATRANALALSKVLVIDDDEAFGRALSGWLIELGYQVVVAPYSTGGGLALLERGGFTAVLLDMDLPDRRGHTIIQQLNRLGVSVPIIVMSGTQEIDDVVGVWREGAADVVRKPFGLDDLSGALDRARMQRPDEHRSLQEAMRTQLQLDCSPITVVRLDRHARVTHVNEAWRRFARDNGANAETIKGVGLDYIAAATPQIAEAVAEMVAGRKESFTCIYPCHSATQIRWFRLDAQRIAADDAVVLIHTNVTDHHLAEARLRMQAVVAHALAQRTPLLDTWRRIIGATCEGLECDLAAIWIPAQGGDRLLCAEAWRKPGSDDAADDAAFAFENTTRTTAFESGCGLPGRVWASGSAEWIADFSVVADSPRAPLAMAAGLRTGFAVPIGSEGEVFAVLEFFSRIRRDPDPALLELLETSGGQLGAQVLRERAEQRVVEAQAAQRKIAGTLDAVLACAPAFIIAVDESGKIQFINRVLPHHKREDVIGSDWLEYLPPGDGEQQRARLQRVIETGIFETYETTIAGADGRKLWFSTHIGPMHQGDRIAGAVLVAQEVTDLKDAQAEFASAQRLAAVGTLAAGVAHEINTPIQFVSDSVHFLRDAARDILGLVEKLQNVSRLAATVDEKAPPRVEELEEAISAATEGEEEVDLAYLRDNVPKAFERCLDGLERVGTIVRSMKEFAHPDQREMAPTDLNRAIQNTLTIASNEYKYLAELETDLNEIPFVTCYVNDINQVVLNLVVNAAHAIGDIVKGSDKKGTIKVCTREDADHVVISITDTGGGIPEAIGHRIFEPFFTTKEVGKGTGQGLALAWSMVREKHGGELRFESKVGEGTTFFIRLPIAGKSPSSKRAP